MKHGKRFFLAVFSLIIAAGPLWAVFNEKDLGQTLSVLRFELREQNRKMENARKRLDGRNDGQHRQMVDMVKKCNELSLILYSQGQDYTFDLTYALKEVTQQYEKFSRDTMPYNDVVASLDLEIERYERLIESLKRLPPMLVELPDSLKDRVLDGKRPIMYDYVHDGHCAAQAGNNGTHPGKPGSMTDGSHPGMSGTIADGTQPGKPGSMADGTLPSGMSGTIADGSHPGMPGTMGDGTQPGGEPRRPFVLDEKGQRDRDSCLVYAGNLLNMYKKVRANIERDNEHYTTMNKRLKETYDYAQKRYKVVQNKIFFKGQDNYIKVLSTLPSYAGRAWQECVSKYQKPIDDECDSNGLEELSHMMHNAGGGNVDEAADALEECPADETEEEHAKHIHHEHQHSQWRGPIVLGLIFFVLLYLIIASILTAIIMTICSKAVKALQTESFRQRRGGITLLCGDIIFAVSVMIATQFVHQNFLVLASGLLLVFAWLLAAIVFSMLVHVKPEQMKPTMQIYMPIIIMGLIVISFRIVFIPNKMVNLVYPPLLLLFSIWQIIICTKNRLKVRRSDLIYSWITTVVFVATTIMAWCGYVLLGVQIFIWWLFQFAAASTVTAAYDILSFYEKKVMERRVARYRKEHVIVNPKRKGEYIEATWLFDFVKTAVLPIIAVLTVPFGIWHASDVFDLTEICKELFFKPFVNLSDASGNAILHLSLYKLVLVGCLYFIFRYLNYAMKSFYTHLKLQRVMEQSGNDFVHANEVNLTLASNVITIIVWGIYIIIAIVTLKIPMGAISVVAAGLATGIGLALKDVLNNFIYGIQLMSGRLRVGDYIDCDGVRGKVESITYQSTQILTLEGAIMSFTNSALFSKNFKNLTKNNSYECVKIPVGVHYGANVEQVRTLLLEALKPLEAQDRYGRDIVDPKRGISVAFNGFGDSSVDLVVKQYVLVEEEIAFIAKAKEIIYDTLNANNIEIPFPQRDIYIRQLTPAPTQSAGGPGADAGAGAGAGTGAGTGAGASGSN